MVQGVTVPEVLVMVDFPAHCLKALPLAIVSMEYNSVEDSAPSHLQTALV